MKNHNFNLQLLAYDPQEQPDSNTGASGLSAEMKTFYDMCLIDEASPMLVHEQFGQKRPIPEGQRKDCFFPPAFPLSARLRPRLQKALLRAEARSAYLM